MKTISRNQLTVGLNQEGTVFFRDKTGKTFIPVDQQTGEAQSVTLDAVGYIQHIKPENNAGSMGGIFDTIVELVQTGTNVYNAAAPILDPIRDSIISNAVRSYLPSSAGTAQNPTKYYIQQPTQQPTLTEQTPPPPGLDIPTKIAIGAAVSMTLIGFVLMIVENNTQRTKKTETKLKRHK